MNDKVNAIINYFDEILPDVECELNYENDIQLLIAVVLSAQTTDKSVNKVTEVLYADCPTISELYKLEVGDIEEYIKRLGLYRNKSKNVFKLIKIIFEDYNGIVPNSYEKLVELPGVGRKTANVVLAEFFMVPAIAVDTHVERVSKRLKLAYMSDSVLKVEQKLMKKFPKEKWIKLHHQFIHFGRYICKAQSPQCSGCKLKKYCRYYKSMEPK